MVKPDQGRPSLKPSAQELKQILARHRGWLVDPTRGGTRTTGYVPEAEPLPQHDGYLEEVEPVFADWREEALRSPKQAELSSADLSGADLTSAALSGAHLSKANLTGARLVVAKLRCADLSLSNLTGADLTGAYLNDADLMGAKVTNAVLAYADLTNACYAPASEPPHPHVAGINGLLTVRAVGHFSVGLVQLRKLFREAGLRDLERQATYSIEHAKTVSVRTSAVSAVFRRAAFDWTTAYGLHPFRALSLIVAIWLICVPVYFWSIIHNPDQSPQGSGIYQILPANRIDPRVANRIRKDAEVRRVQTANWPAAVAQAAYFSLLSAVNIGFEQFTPGDWIQRLQPQEYDLQAEGWVRVVAGAQALLSVFLLAMWALTQFGRPFE